MKIDEYLEEFHDGNGFYFPDDLRDAYMKFLLELNNYRDKLNREKQLPLLPSDNVGSSVVDIKIKVEEEVDKFLNPMTFLEKYYSDVFNIEDLESFYDFLRNADDRDVENFQDWFEEGLLNQIGLDANIVNELFVERARKAEEERFRRTVDLKMHLQLVDE